MGVQIYRNTQFASVVYPELAHRAVQLLIDIDCENTTHELEKR